MGTYNFNSKTGDAMGSEVSRFGKKGKREWAKIKAAEEERDPIKIAEAVKLNKEREIRDRRRLGLC